MPQSKERQREQAKVRKQRQRDKQRDIGSVTSPIVGGVQHNPIETVPQSYVQGLTGKFKSLHERPRFLTLSDGQVLDRFNQPEASVELPGIRGCNESI